MESLPKTYICHRAPSPMSIDGHLTDAKWSHVHWTDDFEDIEGAIRPRPRFRTRAKMQWDDRFLYIAAELEEPHVWGTLTEHDSVIFHDNDFEVFLDPDGDSCLYVELEMNALNTTWDLLLAKPYRGGGPAIDGFELKGMKTAVQIQGTLNNSADTDHGWTLEIAIPWESIRQIAGCPCPPRDGDQWRINFSRVEWHHTIVDGKYQKVPNRPEDNWVWSPQGVVDMHRPEKWGILQFATGEPGTVAVLPYEGLKERKILGRVFDLQLEHRGHTGSWASAPRDLGVEDTGVEIAATSHLFEARCGNFCIDQTGRVWRVT